MLKALAEQINPQKTKIIFQEPFTVSEFYPFQKPVLIIGDSILDGDKIYSKEEELKFYTDFSNQLKNETVCDVAQIGSCYYFLETRFPNIKLKDEESHPTELGSIIVAFVIFKKIAEIEFPDIPAKYKKYQTEIIACNNFLNKSKP